MEMELSSPSANSGYEGRVCISCRCGFANYNILSLDFDAALPNSTGFMEESPILQIDGEYLRFCVSDGYLYVIGADADDNDFISKPEKVWMSRYDLREHLRSKSDIDIGLSELKKSGVTVTKMEYPKWKPDITASPSGRRVVVYSGVIEYVPDTGRNLIGRNLIGKKDCDFEVFDTKTEIRTPLPQLILCIPGPRNPCLFYIKDKSGNWIEGRGGHLCYDAYPDPYSWYVKIVAARFIDDNTLHVTLGAGLMFTLNLDSPEEGWKYYGDKHMRSMWDEFVVVGREPLVVLISSEVKVVRRGKEEEEKDDVVSKHPLHLSSERPTRERGLCVRPFVLKYVENQECVTCTVKYGVDEDTDHPFFICDVFKLDLVPGNENDCRPTRLGSYKYLIKKACYSFFVEDVFPFPFPKAIESQKRQKIYCY